MSLAKSLEFLSQYAVELEQKIKNLEFELQRWRPTGDQAECLKCEECGLHFVRYALRPSFLCVKCDTPMEEEGVERYER